MPDEVAPFEDQPLTVEQAQEQLTSAISAFNTAINVNAGLPPAAVAHYAVAIDERTYTEDGVSAGVSVLEPAGQPEWLTHGLLRAVLDMGQFAVVDYDPEDDE